MPPAKSHRRPRCVYRESGARCPRDGDGAPALCRPHKIAFAEQARQAETPKGAARRAGEHLGGIIDDFFHGRPFDPAKVQSAVNEFAWSMGGGYTSYHPDLEPQQHSQFDPPPDFRPPPNWGQREEVPPPPPQGPTPQDLQNARRALGFGPADLLTEDTIKERRRQLARKHHPDRGGSTARMQAINDACDVLLGSLVT